MFAFSLLGPELCRVHANASNDIVDLLTRLSDQ